MHFSTQFLSLSLISMVPSVFAGFHVFSRYQNLCDVECNKKTGVCYPKHYVEWRVGAVPSSQYNCGAFKNDKYFPKVLPQWGQDFNWNGYNLPDICGSGPVDFWVTNNGNTLEIWKHNANPGQRVATCYKQKENKIDCGHKSCDTTSVYDAWVCADTHLC